VLVTAVVDILPIPGTVWTAPARAGRPNRHQRGRPESASLSVCTGNGIARVFGHVDFSTRFSASHRLPEAEIGACPGECLRIVRFSTAVRVCTHAPAARPMRRLGRSGSGLTGWVRRAGRCFTERPGRSCDRLAVPHSDVAPVSPGADQVRFHRPPSGRRVRFRGRRRRNGPGSRPFRGMGGVAHVSRSVGRIALRDQYRKIPASTERRLCLAATPGLGSSAANRPIGIA
jgi:hypothetical protein